VAMRSFPHGHVQFTLKDLPDRSMGDMSD
jgi:hypothetical protein